MKLELDLVLEEAIREGKKAGLRKLEELKRNGAKFIIVQRSNPLDDSSPIEKIYEPMLDSLGFAHIKLNGRNWLVRAIKKNATRKEEFGYWFEYKGIVTIYKGYPSGYELYIRPIEVSNYISVLEEAYEKALEVLKKYGVKGYVVTRLD